MYTESHPIRSDSTKDPLSDLLKPPSHFSGKLRYYVYRYGLLHALASYAGRKCFRAWLVLGPLVTRRYLKRWLNSSGPHVLNLGGGGVLFDRWLTGDVDPRSDVFMDVSKPLPLPSSMIDVVFLEEVIEHISAQDGKTLLKECFRVLKPGGWLRITTPSLDYFARRALESAGSEQEVNDIFYCHGHRHIYSEEGLRTILALTGFAELTQSSYRDASARFGYFDTHVARFPFTRPEWSQYWEARKPTRLSEAALVAGQAFEHALSGPHHD